MIISSSAFKHCIDFLNGDAEYIIRMFGIYQKSKKYMKHITIMKNEENISELEFNTIEIAEKFINGASQLWPLWIRSEDTITMYFFADIIEKMYNEKYISKDDLYQLSEKQIMDLIKNCPNKSISESFNKFMKCNDFIECEEYQKDKFCVNRKVKRRYINPLTKNGRIYDVSEKSKKIIDDYINMNVSKYAYIDI